jgi:AAA15 family ATPase/GTPase
MYTRFRIQNFKSFRDLAFDDLARVNLIAGKNNTGKTSVLEALLLHAGYYLPDVFLRIRKTDAPRRTRDRALSEWDTLFNNFRTNRAIKLIGSIPFEPRTGQLSLSGFSETTLEINLFPSDIDDVPVEIERELRRFDRTYGVQEDVILNNIHMISIKRRPSIENRTDEAVYFAQYDGFIVSSRVRSQGVLPTLFLASRERVSQDFVAEKYSDLDLAGNLSLLVEALRIIEPRLQNVRLIYRGNPPEIYGDIGLEKPLPLSFMGEGFSRLANLIIAMSSVQNGVLLIDEIENGLHHSILPDVWRAINAAAEQFNVQVFATTHSYEAIQAAHKVFSETDDYDFRLHRLDRQDNNEITHVTYDQRTLQTAINMELEVR